MAEHDAQNEADRDRIEMHVPDDEVQYWTTKLGVSEERLRDAVARVGPMLVDVKRVLGK